MESKTMEEYLKELKDGLRQVADTILKTWQLKWSFKALDFIVNTERVSLTQCAQAFFVDNLSKEAADIDVERAVKILLMAGIYGSSSNLEYKELEDKAYEYIEIWRGKIGSIDLLHLIIIERLRDEHFFSEGLLVGMSLIRKTLSEKQ